MSSKKITGILFVVTLLTMVVINACDELTKTYSIVQSNCIGCRECVKACGYGAISYSVADANSSNPYYVAIDASKCVACGECVKVCEYNAIAEGLGESGTTSGTSNSSGTTTDTGTDTNTGSSTDTGTDTETSTGTDSGTTTTTSTVYVVNSSKCTGCGHCSRSCSYGALSFSGGKATINASKCTGCGKCAQACPRSAISKK